jgi:hypothetical protein
VPNVSRRRDAAGVVRVSPADAPALPLVEDAADACLAIDIVHATTVIHEDARYDGRRTVRLTLAEGVERVPPRVLKRLYDHDLGVADVTPQGGFLTVIAT